jgi:hypothetical protein
LSATLALAVAVVPDSVGSAGTLQKLFWEKNSLASLTWYRASSSRWTLNRSSGYRKWERSSGVISLLGETVPGKTFCQALRTGSVSSMA